MLGISTDSAQSHRSFAEKHKLPFPLLSDPTREVTHAWGVEGGIGPIKMPRRVTFVLDPRGRVAQVFDPVNVAGHAEEVLRVLERL